MTIEEAIRVLIAIERYPTSIKGKDEACEIAISALRTQQEAANKMRENLWGQNTISANDMALINATAKQELKPEDVYTFSMRMCDNEIDRDFERFSVHALQLLSNMYIGKSGIIGSQYPDLYNIVKIYKTELILEPGQVTTAGDGYCWLKGYAYMVLNEQTKELISEIKSGSKKEISIGCSISNKVCSVCGKTNCNHVGGRQYDGKLCWFTLQDPIEVYEWSFVTEPNCRPASPLKN